MHSSDIYLDSDLGSNNLFQPRKIIIKKIKITLEKNTYFFTITKKNWSLMLTILGYMK